MADERHFPPSLALRFPAWQREYEAASRETETKRLSQCIEVADVAVLVRRDAIRIGAEYRVEREAIEDALTHLDFLKTGIHYAAWGSDQYTFTDWVPFNPDGTTDGEGVFVITDNFHVDSIFPVTDCLQVAPRAWSTKGLQVVRRRIFEEAVNPWQDAN
jgi:hypothetical protein